MKPLITVSETSAQSGEKTRFQPGNQDTMDNDCENLQTKLQKMELHKTDKRLPKTMQISGLLWLYLLEFGFIVESLEPGYLDFDNLPDTNFSCVGKVIGGYYADLETSCQMFHVCTIGQLDEPMDIRFLCLNGTVFDQETRVCERIDEVDCSKSEKFYHLNLELYGNTQPPILEESPETDPPSPPVKSTTTTTTPTPKSSFYTTSRPVTTSHSKTISSHHFPVDSSPDIRFNPEEINISLNPESPPTIRTKPISFQQQSFSEDRNKHIIVTHTSGYAGEHKQPTVKLSADTQKISITTGQPKVNYGISQSPTPTEINGEFGYQNTEAILDYDTELPPHNYQYHASVPHFQPTAAEVHPYSELYKSSTYRNLYHPTTTTPLKLYHSRATTLRTQNIPKAPPYHYQRTEKATRLPQPLPLYSTLRPLTFSSPAPFSSKRHIDSKRNADHQVPRIIISSSASGTVVDPTGRILNYSIGDTHMLGRTPPASYDDYKEDDISLDPFYRDVPKIKAKEQEVRRQRRSTKQNDSILNEEEETDALKFLLNWYSSYEQSTKIPIPLPSAAITEINNELSSSAVNTTNSTLYDYDDYEVVAFNTTSSVDDIYPNTNLTTDIDDRSNLNDFQQEEIPPEEILDEINNNRTDVLNNDTEYEYDDEYDDYNNEALNTTDKVTKEEERNERYLQYMKLNDRISKIFSNDYVDYSGKPLAYLEAFAKSEAKEVEGKTNYLSTDSPDEILQDNLTTTNNSKNKITDDVLDNPLNITEDNQTATADEITKTLEAQDYVDDNYEPEIYEQGPKITPKTTNDSVSDAEKKEKIYENEKTKYSELKTENVDETFLDVNNREDKVYVSTMRMNTELNIITSTENSHSSKEDYIDDDDEHKNTYKETSPNTNFMEASNNNGNNTLVEEIYKNYDDQNFKSRDSITTDSTIPENANDEILDDITHTELVTTIRENILVTTTSEIPENLSHDKIKYNDNYHQEIALPEQTTTTEKYDVTNSLLNTKLLNEKVFTEKPEVTITIDPVTVLDAQSTFTTSTKVEAKENVTPAHKFEISTKKPEAVIHRTVTRGRLRFRQNSGRFDPITNLKNKINGKTYNKIKNQYSTSMPDVTTSNAELNKSDDEQIIDQKVNLNQDALRKMAAQAFSLHKKQEATTENIESVINKAILRSRGRFGHNERKEAEIETPREGKEISTTFVSLGQGFDSTTAFSEEIFTTNTEYNEAVTTSSLSSLKTESYTTTSTTEATETSIIDGITTELPTTYLQKIIENVETTTKSIATSILLPITTVGLASTSVTEGNYFMQNDALLTSTEISSTTQAHEGTVTTSKPIHTTSRRLGSRGRPFQYSRRTTTPRRTHSHRFDIQSRRRYDRRKSYSEENETSTENKTVTDATSTNSSFNYVNNKNSVVTSNLNSLEQRDTSTTISVLNTNSIIETDNNSFIKNRKFKLEENTDQKEENVTDPSFSKSANPTLAKESKDELSTTPISRFIKIKVRKEKMHKSYVFNCFGKKIKQYYSDPRDCRLFHYCTPGFTRTQLLDMKFVCDFGTYFDEAKLTCTKEKPERCR